jgi:hypothetical protein
MSRAKLKQASSRDDVHGRWDGVPPDRVSEFAIWEQFPKLSTRRDRTPNQGSTRPNVTTRRLTGPEIAERLRLPPSTVGRVLSRTGLGKEYLHVAVDDATRVAFAELYPRQDGASCAMFLMRSEQRP